MTHRQNLENKSKSFWQQGIEFTKVPPARKFLIVLIVQTVKLPLTLRPLRASLIMQQASKYEARVN